jgi:ribosomal protein L10
MTMKHDPIVLDEHRGMAAQQATELRRRLAEVEADQAALRARRTELEKFLLTAPAST